VPDELIERVNSLAAERPRILVIVGYSESDEVVVQRLIKPLESRWRVVRIGPTASGEWSIPLASDAALGQLRLYLTGGSSEVPGWEYVPFQHMSDLGAALDGRGLGPSDVVACPRLPEVKFTKEMLRAAHCAWQIAPQFKLWFSRDWTAADKVGVVGTDTLTGLTLSRNMIVAAPSVRPRLIPSLAFPIYPGSGDFAWAPVASMDLKGAKGDKFAFGDVGRLKLEAWTYYFPTAPAAVNVRFGIAPFASYRAFGTDDFRRWEYGGIVQLWVGSTFFEVL
jgi:hypothetical protein